MMEKMGSFSSILLRIPTTDPTIFPFFQSHSIFLGGDRLTSSDRWFASRFMSRSLRVGPANLVRVQRKQIFKMLYHATATGVKCWVLRISLLTKAHLMQFYEWLLLSFSFGDSFCWLSSPIQQTGAVSKACFA